MPTVQQQNTIQCTSNTYISAACEKGKRAKSLSLNLKQSFICYIRIKANNLLQGTGAPYLNHVHPLPNIKEAPLTGDVVQQQHAVGPAEIRLCNAAKPDERK